MRERKGLRRILLSSLLISSTAWAGFSDYYKNTLIGGRAGTMGGAYVAISDDATGTFYNPAGMSFAPSNSLSGSAKLLSFSSITYENAIGGENWNRESNNFLPSFFGMVKKSKNLSYGLSFILQDAYIEHQDQTFKNITNVANPIDIYLQNYHVDDQTNLYGGGFAYAFNPDFSMGLNLHLHQRTLRSYLHYAIEYNDGDDEMSFSNTSIQELGIRLKPGVLIQLTHKLSMGVTFGKTFILSSENERQLDFKTKGSINNELETVSSTTTRNTPNEFSLGLAYFFSPSLVFSGDFDIFLPTDNDDVTVVNISMGMEYYVSQTKSLRMGVYTNNTNNKPVSSQTSLNDNVNLLGFTTGMSFFEKSNSLTFGIAYSFGSGEAQIYEGVSTATPMSVVNLSAILSSTYGF